MIPFVISIALLTAGCAVMWTGSDTFCDTLEAADLDRVRAAIGRDPVIWDNFWANDGGDGLMGRILLSAYTGRGPDLPSVTRGIVFNPGIQGALARLQLAMGARYLDAPAYPDPSDQRARAVEAELATVQEEGGRTGDAVALELVLSLFEAHGMQTPRHVAMEEEVAALDPDLVDELVFPLQKIAHEGEAGLQALSALGQKLSGNQAADFLAAARTALDRSAECRFLFAPGTLAGLVESVESLAAEDRGVRAPAHAGSYDLIVTAVTPDGWAWRKVGLVCEE